MQRELLTKNYQRVVIKVGTSLLCDASSKDGINYTMLESLRDEILFLRGEGKQVMLVSSGAVYVGSRVLHTYGIENKMNTSISQRQALSALGQNTLMTAYQKTMAVSGIPVAQLLLTALDFQNRRSYLNIQHTIRELLGLGVLGIVNENDTVATDELQFGENDLLSAACAALFYGELLVILTSVDGFFTKNGKRISYIDRLLPEHWQAAQGPEGPGRGGMRTKLRAAQLCNMSGIHCAILPGRAYQPIRSFFAGQDLGSLFAVRQSYKLSARKKWILFAGARGVIIVDAGARKALEDGGSSLLPMGVRELHGQFLPNEVVKIKDENGLLIGRGLINYSYREVLPMLGLSLQEMKKRNLLWRTKELVHRNNFVLETSNL